MLVSAPCVLSVCLPDSLTPTPAILPSCWSFLKLAEFFPSISLRSCLPSQIVCLGAGLESWVLRGWEACSWSFSLPILCFHGACSMYWFTISPVYIETFKGMGFCACGLWLALKLLMNK